MRIVECASEAIPFAKTGGLGDVLGALPEELAKAGHDVIQFLPYYQSVRAYRNVIQPTIMRGDITIGDKSYAYSVEQLTSKRSSLTFYFIRCDMLFNRPELYRDNTTNLDYTDNDDRFILFNRAIIESLAKLHFAPDILHCHDWQASLIPAYIKFKYADNELFKKTKTVLTIHNLAFQGTFVNTSFPKLDLPMSLYYPLSPFEFYGKLNFLKAAISYADHITTVSQRYAEEIQTETFGCGLEGILSERSGALSGIVNGVDYKIWSPSRDKKIPYNYHKQNLSNKRANKVEFINTIGLPLRDKSPLIGIISRLADQKGFDLIEEIADDLFSRDIQVVLLGTGDKKYHDHFERLEQTYPDKLKAFFTFDEDLAHQIEAASDIFLMPSRFEPCGLNQMYSLKYGTVPLVRKVGGLADTVKNFDETSQDGTGIVFDEYTGAALLEAVDRTIALFNKNRIWIKLMKQGMTADWSWKMSAIKYLDLFQKL